MMTFREWLPDTYHELARQYRWRLAIITNEVRIYCSTGICEARHIDCAIGLLREVPIPVLPKYPGSVSPEDQEWFRTQRRPDWENIRLDYETQVKQFKTAPAGTQESSI